MARERGWRRRRRALAKDMLREKSEFFRKKYAPPTEAGLGAFDPIGERCAEPTLLTSGKNT